MAMIEKGQHLFFPMKNGRTIPDKDQNPRYCLNRENAERFRWYYDELVEYAPKKRGEWMADEDGWNCSRCGAHITKKDREDHEWWYCTICGSQNLESWLPWQD